MAGMCSSGVYCVIIECLILHIACFCCKVLGRKVKAGDKQWGQGKEHERQEQEK